MRLALNGGTYQARTVAAAAQSAINVFPEKIEDANEKEKGGGLTIGCPGKHLFANLSAIGTPCRGLWSGGGKLFYAGGARYAEVNSSGAVVGSVRTIADDADHSPVLFYANGTQLFIVSAEHAYCDNGAGPIEVTLPGLVGTAHALGQFVYWDSGDTFTAGLVGKSITVDGNTETIFEVLSPTQLTVTSPFAGSPAGDYTTTAPSLLVSSGAYGDGYFMVSQINTRQFNISPLLNGTGDAGDGVWNSLDYGVKESYPDYIRSILWSNEQLYLFGTDSLEVWQNVGSQLVNGVASFPFQRIDGATAKYGSVSPNSPIAIGGQVFFLGGDSTGQTVAYILNGFTPKRISTYAIENAWNNALLGSTAVSASYLEEGHTFWEISFGPGQFTWVYDITTGVWHQRASWNGSSFTPYGRTFHTFVTNSTNSANDWGAGGKHLVGGDGTSNVYEQSLNFYDEAGADMAWQRAMDSLYNAGNRMYFSRMTLEMETGAVASGLAPVITRDYSDDRGETFSNPQTASLGTHNQWTKRVFWPVGGSSRGRIFRLSGSGQSKVALVCCDVDITMGTN